MVGNTSKFASPPNNLDSQLRFCKASFFPNLRSSNNGFYTERKTLNQIISASGDEATRLSKYSFEYFIAYSPDANGNNSSGKKKSELIIFYIPFILVVVMQLQIAVMLKTMLLFH